MSGKLGIVIVALALTAAAFVAACDGSGLAPPASGKADAGADSGSGPVTPESQTRLAVLDRLIFAAVDGAGVTQGFDLDGHVSGAADAAGCYTDDLSTATGELGIDNVFGTLLPFFAVAGIGAAESLLQSTIEEGGILIMMQLEGVDDALNDDSVRLTVRAGQGKPLIATDGLLLPGQTFHLRPDSPDTTTQNARIVDGVLTAGPVDTFLRVKVLGDEFEMPIHGAMVRARLVEGGGLVDGVIGAGIAVADLLHIGETNGDVKQAMDLLFPSKVDLAPDAGGTCTQISATIAFTAVSAFLFDAPAP
jgi:hypothetical protein